MASTLNASTTLGLISSADTSGVLQLQTANTAAVTINASQNVGIGTASPSTKLDVNGNLNVSSAGNIFTASTSGIFFNGNGSYATGIYNNGSGNLLFAANGSLRATIDPSGNLGLGVTPYAWTGSRAFDLELYGNLNTWDDGSLAMIQLGFNYYQTGSTFKYKVGSLASMYRQRGGVHSWFNAPSGTAGNAITFTQAMTLDASGNLLVGTTSQSGKLAVSGNATSAALVTFYSSTAGDVGQAGLLIGKTDNNTTTSQVILRATILSTGAGAGQINMNGANSLAFGTYSDQRLKENIVDLDPQLANILALRPVEFDYIASEGGGHQTGFIAQEIQQIYSDAVGEREDGMLTVSGWSKTEARLVKAIQEQQALIQSLKARLDAANL